MVLNSIKDLQSLIDSSIEESTVLEYYNTPHYQTGGARF